LGDAEFLERLTAVDLISKSVQHFLDRISGNKYSLALYALPHQIVLAAMGVRHQKSAGVIDYAAVYLFRHAVVITAISRFHVIYGNAAPGRRDRGQGAVGVAKNKNFIGFMLGQDVVGFGKYLADLVAE